MKLRCTENCANFLAILYIGCLFDRVIDKFRSPVFWKHSYQRWTISVSIWSSLLEI